MGNSLWKVPNVPFVKSANFVLAGFINCRDEDGSCIDNSPFSLPMVTKIYSIAMYEPEDLQPGASAARVMHPFSDAAVPQQCHGFVGDQ